MNNDQEEIEIDNTGMTAKTYDDITDSYDDHQLRITHNVLAFTEDNWETVSTAVGEFTFTMHPFHTYVTTPVESEEYGLVAKAVLAGKITGSKIEGSDIMGGHLQAAGNKAYIDLYNASFPDPEHSYTDFIHYESGASQFIVTKDGNLSTTGGHFSNGIAPNIRLTETAYLDLNRDTTDYPYFLSLGGTSSGSSGVFRVTKEDGTLITRGGHFQNFNNSSYMDLGSGIEATTYLDEHGFLRKKYFEYFLVSHDPEIFSVNKDGYIIATSGKIGGFYISPSYISSNQNLSNNTDSNISLSKLDFSREIYSSTPEYDSHGNISQIVIGNKYLSSLRFAIGNSFGVTSDGNIYANNMYVNKLSAGDTVVKNLAVAEDVEIHGDVSMHHLEATSVTTGELIANQASRIDSIAISTNVITQHTLAEGQTPVVYITENFRIEDGIPYELVGEDWYRLYPMIVSPNPAPADLQDGVVWLQYE